jgi:hypothetical protein
VPVRVPASFGTDTKGKIVNKPPASNDKGIDTESSQKLLDDFHRFYPHLTDYQKQVVDFAHKHHTFVRRNTNYYIPYGINSSHLVGVLIGSISRGWFRHNDRIGLPEGAD